jgi:DNA-binding transcriptional MocR family regulator
MSVDPGFLWALDRAKQHDFSTVECCIWLILVGRANSSRKCWPSVESLMRDANTARGTVYKALAQFKALDLIRVESRCAERKASVYYVNRPGAATATPSPMETTTANPVSQEDPPRLPGRPRRVSIRK